MPRRNLHGATVFARPLRRWSSAVSVGERVAIAHSILAQLFHGMFQQRLLVHHTSRAGSSAAWPDASSMISFEL